MAKTKRRQVTTRDHVNQLINDLEIIAERDKNDLYVVMGAVTESAAYLALTAKIPERLFAKNAKAYYRREKEIRETLQKDLKDAVKRMKNAERATKQTTKTKKLPVTARKGTVRKRPTRHRG